MDSISEYYEDHPLRTIRLNNSDFSYRYYKNPRAAATLVLLTGGIGRSDLLYLHFIRLAEDFSVLTFDYHPQYKTIGTFSDAVALLLEQLDIKSAWFLGNSLGGAVAQVIAKRHPEAVEGLILSNAASLARDMNAEARSSLLDVLAFQRKMKRLVQLLPFRIYQRLVRRMLSQYRSMGLTLVETALMDDLADEVVSGLSRSYELHMLDFMLDAANYQIMLPQDFTRWKGKVLLFLSADDHTFNDAVKQSLIGLMPEPEVVTHLTGGHLAMIVRLEDYAQAVCAFITGCPDSRT